MDARTRTRGRRAIAAIAGRVSYANVAATLALIVALGTGGAYAANQITAKDIAKNAVRAKHIKKNQVKAKHVARNTIGTPKIRDGAVTPAKLTADPVHVIGAAGEIPFGSGWEHGGVEDEEEVPGFWKDPAGTVHLRGAAGRSSGAESVMFTLPAGYRPSKQQWFITYGSGLTQAYVSVNANGDVIWEGGTSSSGPIDNSGYVGLGNITFLADQ